MSRLNWQSQALARQTVVRSGSTGALGLPAGVESLVVYFNVVEIVGAAPSVVFTLNFFDPVSGNSLGGLLSTPAVTATGETVLQVSPHMAAVANSVAQSVVPSQVGFAWALSVGTVSVTFEVNAEA